MIQTLFTLLCRHPQGLVRALGHPCGRSLLCSFILVTQNIRLRWLDKEGSWKDQELFLPIIKGLGRLWHEKIVHLRENLPITVSWISQLSFQESLLQICSYKIWHAEEKYLSEAMKVKLAVELMLLEKGKRSKENDTNILSLA